MSATTPLPVLDPTTMRVADKVEVDASLAVPALDHADDWGDDCPPALDAAGKLNPAAWDTAALRVPQDARSGVAAVFGALPDLPAPEVLLPGSTWTGPDGTVYDVVRAEDVGDRPRWLVPVGVRGDQVGLEEPDELHTDAAPGGAGMLLALVLRDRREPLDAGTGACSEVVTGIAPMFSLESARAMLANLEHLPPDVSADDARVDLWVELRAACAEVERLRADVLGLAAELGAAEGARDGARSRLDGLRESLYIVARRLGANLPAEAERYAEDAALRVELGVAELQRAHATLERSRDRWQARARKAEARVAVLTEERDGLTLRLGQQVRREVVKAGGKLKTVLEIGKRAGGSANHGLKLIEPATGRRAPARTRKGGR